VRTTPGKPSPTTQDDAEDDLRLVEAIRRGDTSGWSRLITRYQDRLYSVCYRMVHHRELAADLTQDAFVKIIQGLDSFDGRAKLSTWMIRVTMNVCLSRLRSEKLRKHASLDAPAGGGGDSRSKPAQPRNHEQSRELSPDDRVDTEEARSRVLEALRRIDPEQRAVIILCDCHGKSYEQIAEVLGVAVGTVKSRLFRARAALREAVENLSEAQRGKDQ